MRSRGRLELAWRAPPIGDRVGVSISKQGGISTVRLGVLSNSSAYEPVKLLDKSSRGGTFTPLEMMVRRRLAVLWPALSDRRFLSFTAWRRSSGSVRSNHALKTN
jgi:hypothetical protein